jgi:hypothetical protein
VELAVLHQIDGVAQVRVQIHQPRNDERALQIGRCRSGRLLEVSGRANPRHAPLLHHHRRIGHRRVIAAIDQREVSEDEGIA